MTKIIKLVSINLLVFLFLLIIGFTILEIFSSSSDSDSSEKGSLVFDNTLGWDSYPSIEVIEKKLFPKKKIMFIGDSFTHRGMWAYETVKTLNKEISVEGYSLGASGFSTIQSFLKLERYFHDINPDLVILLFYAWNDMRDNNNKPAIIYSPKTEIRPYLNKNLDIEKNKVFSNPNWFKKLNIYQKFFIKLKLRINTLLVQSLGIELISKKKIKLDLDYTNDNSWIPFYTQEAHNSDYVQSSWKITEIVIKKLNKFITTENKKLIIVGIDNAFTVDNDVRKKWTDGIENFDIYKNINYLKKICEKNNIFFINGLSVLEKERKTINKKIYNYPIGNLSGHLEPEGNLVISNAVVNFIKKNKILD